MSSRPSPQSIVDGEHARCSTLAERSWIGAPTLRLLEMGGGLATWAIATDALGADLAALRVAGSDLGDPIAGERRRADGAVVGWRLATAAHPRAVLPHRA